MARGQPQREQDGHENRAVELERAIAEGITMIERRDTMEFFRECAAEQFRIHARKAWTPRTGSRVRHKTMTAAMIDSRDFMDKRLREKAQALIPERSEEHTSELQSLMRSSYAVFGLKKKK